uniref:SKP1-like protein n=1 Tax=Vannella robusta TaxID=1487602 RepID=A0A7S4M8G2_9EUKA|mmetsp:Transcript_14409/g.18274  ORF Transcript_14409/g.18274 Transcript_14409/m.18274 type:complete len:157 (+) Transcript_14409:67-537(+)
MEVVLRSMDDVCFPISREACELSGTLVAMMGDMEEADVEIPLPNITGRVLKCVVDYLEFYHSNPPPGEGDDVASVQSAREAWEQQFFDVDQALLFEFTLASNYLDIAPMLDAVCKVVAGMIKGKDSNEIRQIFNIRDGFTPEEEALVAQENQWTTE